MPLEMNTNSISEKNKINSDSTWLILLEIRYLDDLPMLFCYNNTPVVWPAESINTWNPAIFSLSGMTETKDAEIPAVTLEVRDLSHIIIPYLEESNGGIGAEVIIRIVNSKYLTNPSPELTETMEIIGCSIDFENKISFSLGAENLLTRRCPTNRYLKNHCRFIFKDTTTCQYDGIGTSCGRSLADCKELGNEIHFGGFPGVGNSGFIV